jgi:hypothetical protein
VIPEHPGGNDLERIISAHAIAMKPVTVSFGGLGSAVDEWCYVRLVMDPCYFDPTTTHLKNRTSLSASKNNGLEEGN